MQSLPVLEPSLSPRSTLGQPRIGASEAIGRRFVRDLTLVGGSTLFGQVLGAATAIVLRHFLDPSSTGVWQGLKLILSYANYANLGVSKGAAREISLGLGRGEPSPGGRAVSLAFTVNVLASVLCAAGLAAAGLWVLARGGAMSTPWGVGLIATAGLLVLNRYVTFQVTILRARMAFAAASRLTALEAILTLAATAAATWLWGFYGLLAATAVVMLGSLIFLSSIGAAPPRPAWNANEIRGLAAVGAPILAAGALSSLYRSLDKLMILAYLPDGEFQLGCYSTALLVTGQLFGLANVGAIALGPRCVAEFGRTADRSAAARLTAKAVAWQAVALGAISAAAILIAPPLLGWLLPDYAAGLRPLAVLVPGAVALGLTLSLTQYLIAVNRQGAGIAALIGATLLAALGNHAALQLGYGVMGVGAVTSTVNLAYLAAMCRASIWNELPSIERRALLLGLAAGLAPCAVMAWAAATP